GTESRGHDHFWTKEVLNVDEVKVIKRSNCDNETTQTPGMSRLAGVAKATAGAKHMWMGFVTMGPGAKSGAHHHGHCESAIYIISGHARFRWGNRLEHVSEAGPGDFIYVPANLIHQEINPSNSEPIEMIVARDSSEGVVVNVDVPGAE
ncbi:MAG: cupin domain-containing protein, partial [Candidatus Binatia bacterium]